MNEQDITFRNNQNFLLVFNMSQWALLYNLTTVKFGMQVRDNPGDPLPVYAFASMVKPGVRGTISYDPATQLLLISATYADARTYFTSGIYAYDLTMEIDDVILGTPLIIRDAVYGSLTVTDGVTLT